jgi:hypothetical protein
MFAGSGSVGYVRVLKEFTSRRGRRKLPERCELISDNWFDLLPGVTVQVRLAAGCKAESIHFEAVTAK